MTFPNVFADIEVGALFHDWDIYALKVRTWRKSAPGHAELYLPRLRCFGKSSLPFGSFEPVNADVRELR